MVRGNLHCDFAIVSPSDSREVLWLRAELTDPSGLGAGSKEAEILAGRGVTTTRVSFHVDKPKLWNAESPRLYELNVRLVTNDGLAHAFKRKVGLREVTIDGDVLKLNHKQIKIRGVNHHDIHPDVGRAMRLEHYRQDVELMKNANINAVRTVEKVKELDQTRPTLLPGAGSGGSYKTELPECAGIMAPHHPYPGFFT